MLRPSTMTRRRIPRRNDARESLRYASCAVTIATQSAPLTAASRSRTIVYPRSDRANGSWITASAPRRRSSCTISLAGVFRASSVFSRYAKPSTATRARFLDEPRHPERHEVVDRAGGRDELGLRLHRGPDEKPRVLRDAVASYAGAGHEHHAERAGVDELPHLVGVHAEFLRDQRDLVREGDLHVPVRVLRRLDDLRGCPVRRMDLGLHEATVEGEPHAQTDRFARAEDAMERRQVQEE